jgi:hypothetical protein
MASPQVLHLVEPDSIQARLSRRETPVDTVEEFYRFGTMLFSEIQQRGSEVDRKLTNLLGLSVATLAFLLFNQSRFGKFGGFTWIAMVTAAVLSFGSAATAAVAVKTRMWRAPSEADWFKDELWADPLRLKCYHIVSMLTAHQAQARNIKTKAECLGVIEIFLMTSAMIILSVLLFS